MQLRIDNQGVISYILVVVLGVSLVTSAAVISTTSPSSRSNTDQSTDSVQGDVEDALSETNNIIVQNSDDSDYLSRYAGETVEWSGMDHMVGRANLGSLLASIEAQQAMSGSVTRVEPTGDGVTAGSYMKQEDAGTLTQEVTYTEYYDVDHTHYTDHQHSRNHEHTRNHRHSYTDRVYYTETHERSERRSREVTYHRNHRHREAYYTYERIRTTHRHTRRSSWGHRHRRFVCYGLGCGYVSYTHYHTRTRSYNHYHTSYRKVRKYRTSIHRHSYTRTEYYNHYYTVTHRHSRSVTRYRDHTHYYDHTHYSNHVHANNHVHTESRDVTKTVNTAGGSYTHNGQVDYTIMNGVENYRDSQFTIGSAGLTEEESEAFQLIADGSSKWTLTAQETADGMKITTSDGFSQEYKNAESVTIDPATGTILVNGGDRAGETDSIAFANHAGKHDLKVKNGDVAFGHFEVLSDGSLSDDVEKSTVETVDSTDVTNRAADNIVYSADLDITYESGDTTFTNRLYVEPTVE